MATFQCDIVSAETEIFSGRVQQLSATGTIGELGIMPGHAPLLTGIRPGPLRLTLEDGEEDVFFASGGFLEVQPGIVTVLADTALRADDIDEAAAKSAQEHAEKELSDQRADLDLAAAAAALAESLAQQRTLDELRKRRR
ncbi:MAG: F0F1 ATP synthase subunit epsilon [Pseudomonadaceae bacterium]|nr:F0F1 ATP synthase subunit epsilon [Pseudomonadaceae bacterium]